MKKSWKGSPTMPRFLAVAVRKGLKIADSIGIDEANDKSRITITFKKSPARSPGQADRA